MHLLDSFPILLVDDELRDETAAGRATRSLITAADLDDAEQIVRSTASISCLLIDWDVHHEPAREQLWTEIMVHTVSRTEALVRLVRERDETVPIFLLADHSTAAMLPTEVLRIVTGYVVEARGHTRVRRQPCRGGAA